MMKTILTTTPFRAIAVFSIITLFSACQENTKTPEVETTVQTTISPAPFPTNIVPGFKFPEDTATIINGWLGGYTAQYFDTVSIYKHAWGIWAGLTANSGEKWDGQNLLVFETWPGITDIKNMVEEGKTDCPSRTGHQILTKPRQFDHARFLLGLSPAQENVDADPNFWVTIAYDPTAACHATKYQLLDSNVVKTKMKAGGIGTINPFPNTAITTKPTYYVGKSTDSLIMIPAWPGPPSPAKDFPESDWNNWVYIDVANKQPANKKIVPVTSKTSTREQIAAATCNLSDFIYFKLDKAAAAYMNAQDSTNGVTAQAGDLAILVAMHVTTKEISNWTWQTYFWAADADNPPFPSDAVAAGLRPKELHGAASHYAVSTAYAMTRPNQPITGGTNTGVNPVIGYNPYLEPGLGAINSPKFPNKLSPALKWGVQSNCMSCHALASFPGTTYTADQYISMNDPIFIDQVLVDFAWSIQGNMTAKNPSK